MTLPSAASDLPLLEAAAREAGALARATFGAPVEVWQKGAEGPVTEVDLAIDKLLTERLRGARPEYGWLSEETADSGERLGKARCFIVDPIDGTRAFLAHEPQFCISIGLSEGDKAVLGVVYNPILDEMFVGGDGVAPMLNGAPIAPTKRGPLENARLIGRKRFYADTRWPRPWPPLDLEWRLSIAYRLSLIAAGQFDGALMPGFKNEWDTAAGTAILEAAGGRVSDMYGAPLLFNQPDPRAPGAIATGGGELHALLIDRIQHLPHPREWEAAIAAAQSKEAT